MPAVGSGPLARFRGTDPSPRTHDDVGWHGGCDDVVRDTLVSGPRTSRGQHGNALCGDGREA